MNGSIWSDERSEVNECQRVDDATKKAQQGHVKTPSDIDTFWVEEATKYRDRSDVVSCNQVIHGRGAVPSNLVGNEAARWCDGLAAAAAPATDADDDTPIAAATAADSAAASAV